MIIIVTRLDIDNDNLIFYFPHAPRDIPINIVLAKIKVQELKIM
jgi:hypothetical protein